VERKDCVQDVPSNRELLSILGGMGQREGGLQASGPPAWGGVRLGERGNGGGDGGRALGGGSGAIEQAPVRRGGAAICSDKC